MGQDEAGQDASEATDQGWPTEVNPFEPAEPVAAAIPPPPPPPPGFFAPPPPPPTRRGRGPLLAAVSVLVVVAVGAGAFVLLGGEDERDADKALAAAQDAVTDATSFRFTYSTEDTSVTGDTDAGSTTTERSNGEGEWAGDRWHLVTNDGYGGSETIVDGDTSYDRYLEEEGGDLGDEEWTRWEGDAYTRDEVLDELEMMAEDDEEYLDDEYFDEGFDDSMAVWMAASLYLGDVEGTFASASDGTGSGFTADPSGFLHAVQEMSEPVVAGEEGDTLTLAATLTAPEDFVEAYGSPLPEGRVELDLDADDVPTSLRVDVAQNEATLHVEIAFSDWNTPIEIAIPSGDEVDETPWIDEDGVREAAAEVTLFAPTAVPEGYELSLVDPDAAESMELEDDCTMVDIDWDEVVDYDASEEDWMDAGYVWLYQYTTECALQGDDAPFTPGGPGGHPSRESDYDGLLEVQLGDTVIRVDTTLEGADLDAVLASLQPIDVETLIDEAKTTAAGYDS